ncbi:Lcl C-terminal domain-containing protein [Sulfurimonas sp.]
MKKILLVLLMLASLNARDVVYDKTTSLLWQDARENDDLSITFNEAQEYCANLVIDKYKDFRLPTLNELQSIIDYRNYKPAILKGFHYAPNETFWSTTPFADDKEYVWTINFKKGDRNIKAKHYDRYVRCVQKVK